MARNQIECGRSQSRENQIDLPRIQEPPCRACAAEGPWVRACAGSPAAAHNKDVEVAMRSRVPTYLVRCSLSLVILVATCSERPTAPAPSAASSLSADRENGDDDNANRIRAPRCDADNAGLTLPRGFCALV